MRVRLPGRLLPPLLPSPSLPKPPPRLARALPLPVRLAGSGCKSSCERRTRRCSIACSRACCRCCSFRRSHGDVTLPARLATYGRVAEAPTAPTLWPSPSSSPSPSVRGERRALLEDERSADPRRRRPPPPSVAWRRCRRGESVCALPPPPPSPLASAKCLGTEADPPSPRMGDSDAFRGDTERRGDTDRCMR